MSKAERLSDTITQVKATKLIEQHYRCALCHTLIDERSQLAHLIPQRKWCIKTFGAAVIYHPLNMVLVCGLRCNALVQMNPASQQATDLAARILAVIQKEQRSRNG